MGKHLTPFNFISIVMLIAVFLFFVGCELSNGNYNDSSPVIISSNPTHGASDVPVDLNKIQIVFDDEMIETSYSLAWSPSSLQQKVEDTQFIDPNTFEIQLKAGGEVLDYGTSYTVLLNPGSSKNFRNTDGVSLHKNTELSFTTIIRE